MPFVRPFSFKPFHNDVHFDKLLLDLHVKQQHVKLEWLSSRTYQDVNVMLSPTLLETKVLSYANKGVTKTIIPSYFAYHLTWSNAQHNNPFDFDWINIAKSDGVDGFDLDYIKMVLETLEEQIFMWSVDFDTASTILFAYLLDFTYFLRQFYDYIVR